MQALDQDGMPIDLTGATVRYTLRERTGTGFLVTRGAATLVNQTTYPGEAYYPWQAGETGTGSAALVALAFGESLDYVEEWEITYPSGLIESLPTRSEDRVIVRILADLDNT
jgi:hypothetical protein